MILQLLGKNLRQQAIFRNTLFIVKFWARQKGIHSNRYGYLGGISFALLVAYLCLMSPHRQPNTLIRLFFKIFSRWRWDSVFVGISPLKEGAQYELGKMMIMTPTIPQTNTCHNVSHTN